MKRKIFPKFNKIHQWGRGFKKLRISKRQKFVGIVLLLSVGFFLSEYFLGKSGVLFTIFASFLSIGFLYWALRADLTENMTLYVFILPFFYSLAFGLFYFLVPSRFLTRIVLTSCYAIGLYSLYLAENIFTVASIRTIALLASARIVSFVIMLLSYFFLADIVYSLHLHVLITAFIIFFFSFFFITHGLWTVTLKTPFLSSILWVGGLSFCLFEVALMLSFWPSSPTVVALFLTGFFYTIVGTSQVWLERRLFRGVMWEYIWVAVVVFLVLLVFTSWG